MAQVKNPQFGIALRQNRNAFSKSYSAYFPEAVKRKTISTRGLCDHMQEHQTIYSRDVITGVVTKAVSCMIHLLAEGNPIKLDGLGTFTPQIESKKGGISSQQLLEGKWNPQEYIAGVHVRFLPEGQSDEKITSRKFKEKCAFTTEGVLEPVKLSPEGVTPEKWGFKTVPLDVWISQHSGGDGSNGGGDGGEG